jgi:hypothetical protein
MRGTTCVRAGAFFNNHNQQRGIQETEGIGFWHEQIFQATGKHYSFSRCAMAGRMPVSKPREACGKISSV